jgi:hypothetical protein
MKVPVWAVVVVGIAIIVAITVWAKDGRSFSFKSHGFEIEFWLGGWGKKL